MSDLDNLLLDNDNDSDLVRDLRKQLREKTKSEKDLLTKVQDFERKSRSASIADLLKAKNVNPKVAAFIPQDVTADADGVAKWLEEYGDVFGVQPQGETTEQVTTTPPAGADEGAVAALAAAQAAASQGSPAAVLPTSLAALEKATEGAHSLEEIVAKLNQTLGKRG